MATRKITGVSFFLDDANNIEWTTQRRWAGRCVPFTPHYADLTAQEQGYLDNVKATIAAYMASEEPLA